MKEFLRSLGLPLRRDFRINSRQTLALAAETFGMLPFFPNNIRGLSVEEMCAPGMLFGGNYDEGCWEWKGPVIRTHTTAYGKFFRRKAGFVSEDLLPDFLNFRRNVYPIVSGSSAEMLLDIIRENDSLSSTELKSLIFGDRKRKWDDLPEMEATFLPPIKGKSLESPLQRLQMGGWIVISDFEYKVTKRGERYGWGVARYSTPEIIFGEKLLDFGGRTPQESLEYLISSMKKRWPGFTRASWEKLLK